MAKGRELEKKVAAMLEDAKIPYKWEDTLFHKGRRKGGIDFKTDYAWIECKHFTDRLTYKLNSESHDIKWSQVCILNKHRLEGKTGGFILREEADNSILWLDIERFLNHYTDSEKKSINIEELKEIAEEIKDMEFIKEADNE